jgi:TPR repeat protein
MVNFDVFISYPHQEKPAADAVCATLEVGGIRCWIAPRDVPPGAEWADAIVDAIDHCKAMVLVFSSYTNGSKQIRREVQRAFDREKPVIPLRIENVVPESGLAYYMAPVHWLDAFTPPLQQHLDNLKKLAEALIKSESGGQAHGPKKFNGGTTQSHEHTARGTNGGAAARLTRAFAISIFAAVVLGGIGFWIATGRHWISTETASNPASAVISGLGSTTSGSGPSSGVLADILAAANRGDPAAENTLGIKFAQGEDGLPHDDTKAVEWYRKSALQGYSNAETNLGDMYFYGRGGLSQSYADAAFWYLKAAQQNVPGAQFRLAYMYEKGIGTNKDEAHAVQLYRRAADLGDPEAQNELGVLYAVGGDGIAEDDKQSVAWYQRAADQGFPKAEKNLGDMYFFGRGVDKDYEQAFIWYQKAADQGFPDAQFRLGFMYERGLGTQQSSRSAIEQYTKAAHSGSVDAQGALDRLGIKE